MRGHPEIIFLVTVFAILVGMGLGGCMPKPKVVVWDTIPRLVSGAPIRGQHTRMINGVLMRADYSDLETRAYVRAHQEAEIARVKAEMRARLERLR